MSTRRLRGLTAIGVNGGVVVPLIVPALPTKAPVPVSKESLPLPRAGMHMALKKVEGLEGGKILTLILLPSCAECSISYERAKRAIETQSTALFVIDDMNSNWIWIIKSHRRRFCLTGDVSPNLGTYVPLAPMIFRISGETVSQVELLQ